ncbi:unnamed protein product [Adineta steineri]|uniref:Ionotropic glutamate receptor C-terminal domain-containing protein n=1 Tax=Adineta steineri TaxID=433720 RepID=A0A819VYB7_9BILA|nr:unnamed protein product [Adineta steineri]CAF4117568.1 unnamed protein product [Adineta steineri]
MASWWSFRHLWLYFTLGQFNVLYVKTDWPSVDTSNVQLLSVFYNAPNGSDPLVQYVHSLAMFRSAMMLAQRYNITIQGQFIGWQSITTSGDPMRTLGSTCEMTSNSNIVGIVGPSLSRESEIIAPFAAITGIPVISHDSTTPALSDRSTYPTFYRTIPADDTAALAIGQLFIRFNWTSCVVIYQNDAFGQGFQQAISDVFNNYNLTIAETIMFDIATLNIRGDLKSLLINNPTRIVLLWAQVDYATLILQSALNSGVLGPSYTWILSAEVEVSSFDPQWYANLIGMFTLEAVVGNVINAPINTTLLNAAYNMWQMYEPESFPGAANVDYTALFAFDAAWTLVQALVQLCPSSSNNSLSSCISFTNDTFCFNKLFLNTNNLLNTIDSNTFLGVTGPIQFSANTTNRVSGAYFILKNVQSPSNNIQYVPVMSWSNSQNWALYSSTSIIFWPGITLTPPSDSASASGVTFRIAIIESIPFMTVTQTTDSFGNITTTHTGYMPDLINLLQTNMNFTPQLILIPSDSSYNSLVEGVANGLYDMVVADLTVTSARTQLVDFSTSIFDNSMRVIIRQAPDATIDYLAYLKPFSRTLWLTILGTTVYSSILIFLLERQHNEALQDRSHVSAATLSVWYSLATIMAYGPDFNVSTAAGRLLTVGLYILSLILIAAYTANLASDLTIQKSQSSISGIDDIKNGKVAYSRIGIIVDSSIEEYYLQEVSNNKRNFYPLTTIPEIYGKLLDGTIDASIEDAGVLEYATGHVYCNLTLVGADFDSTTYGIPHQKNWIYAKELDVTLLTLREQGLLDNLRAKWFGGGDCSQTDDSSTAMTVESMAGLFLTFGAISILSLLLYVWLKRKVIINYFRAHKRRRTSIITPTSPVIPTSIVTATSPIISTSTVTPTSPVIPTLTVTPILSITTTSTATSTSPVIPTSTEEKYPQQTVVE